jgi:hypothetical protein
MLKFTVIDEANPDITTDRVSPWYLTEAATPYTMRNLQNILVHNAKTDADKDKVRDYFHKLNDTDELDLKKFNGAQAWLTVTQSDRQFTRNDGTTSYYSDYELTSWESKAPKPLTVDDLGGEPLLDLSDVPFGD